MGDTINELKSPGAGGRIATFQQKLPKIAVPNASRNISEVLETPSPTTYRRNVENQRRDLVETVRNGTGPGLASQSTTAVVESSGAVVNGGEMFVNSEGSNNNRMVTASQNSIKPPPKKQKIDMSTFDSGPPKVERTISGTVLTKLEAPKLKLKIDPQQNNNLGQLQTQSQLSVNSDYQGETAEARNEPRAANNPFDAAFKTANNSPMTEMNGPASNSSSDQRQQDGKYSGQDTKPLTPLKTSDIPDLVQQLDEQMHQNQMGSVAVGGNAGSGRMTTMQVAASGGQLTSATALKQSSIATIGNSLFLVAPNSNVPLLLSPKFQPLLAAAPQPAIITNSTNQSFVQPHQVITLAAPAADATNAQPLIFLPNPQAASIQQIVPASSSAAHQSSHALPPVNDLEQLVSQQQQMSNKLAPSLSNPTTVMQQSAQQQQQQLNGNVISAPPTGLRPPPVVTSALGTQNGKLNGVTTGGGGGMGAAGVMNGNGEMCAPSAKAIMREQLERKKNNSSIVATVTLSANRGDNLGGNDSTVPVIARGGTGGMGGAAGIVTNSVMSLTNGSSMAAMQNGSNFLADSTTRLGEQDPRYSLTREKNREAAQRCREKRKKWIANLQEENSKMKTENVKLKEQVSTLQHELMDLKTRLLNEHSLSSHYINSNTVSAVTAPLSSQTGSVGAGVVNNTLQMLPSTGNSSGMGNGGGGGQEMMISPFASNSSGASNSSSLKAAPASASSDVVQVMPMPPTKPKPHLPFSDHILNGITSHLSVPQHESKALSQTQNLDISSDPNMTNPVTFTSTVSSIADVSRQDQSIFSQSQNPSNFSEYFYDSNEMDNDFDTENENNSDQFMSSDDLKQASETSVTQPSLPIDTVDIFQSTSLHAFTSEDRRGENVLMVENQQRPSSTGNLPSIKSEMATTSTAKSMRDGLLHNNSAGVVINVERS